MSIADCQCQFLQVRLANDALAKQSDKHGTYEVSVIINGKSSWKSGTSAIWYYQGSIYYTVYSIYFLGYYPSHNNWYVGKISNIGTNTGGIHAAAYTEYDCPKQVPKEKWKYYDGSHWQEASSNDISFHCTSVH